MQNYKPQGKTKLIIWEDVNFRTIFFIIIAIIFALLPLAHNFIPDNTEYKNVKTNIELTEGENQIGNVYVVIENGKVISAEVNEKEVINRVFGFLNFRKFVFMTSPFFSILFLTLFLGYILLNMKNSILKRLAKVIFFFYMYTSMFYILWIFIPPNDFDPVYYRIYIAIGALLLWGIVLCSYKYFKSKQTRVSILINHILRTRVETVYPLAETEDKEEKAELVKENDKRIVATIKKIKTHA